MIKVVITLPTNVILGKLEIRVGFEILSTFGQPLIDRNTICAQVTADTQETEFIINCTEALMGKYLSIQLMNYGSLHLDEVKVLPEPGIEMLMY